MIQSSQVSEHYSWAFQLLLSLSIHGRTPILEWRFNGIKPLVQNLLPHSDNERLEAFLTYPSPTAIAKQLNPLQLLASCKAVKSEENKIFVRMLNDYKKKHNL